MDKKGKEKIKMRVPEEEEPSLNGQEEVSGISQKKRIGDFFFSVELLLQADELIGESRIKKA